MTTDPNQQVRPIDDKAMPVLLLTKEEEEAKVWMRAPWDEARELARALPDEGLIISSRKPYGIVDPLEIGGAGQTGQRDLTPLSLR